MLLVWLFDCCASVGLLLWMWCYSRRFGVLTLDVGCLEAGCCGSFGARVTIVGEFALGWVVLRLFVL